MSIILPKSESFLSLSQQIFDNAKRKDRLTLKCKSCKLEFTRLKRDIIDCIRYNTNTDLFCTKECFRSFSLVHHIINCAQCCTPTKVMPYNFNKSTTKRFYCSKSCAAIYNNTHKKFGTRRSKLEIWIETQLTVKYPLLTIDYNKKNAINSELDIYIDQLKFAVELNGIYHYESIYGQELLQKTQNNDKRKFQACLERGIELCIINTSSQRVFKPKTSAIYLDIITNIIDSKV